jgi:hypothetical protein
MKRTLMLPSAAGAHHPARRGATLPREEEGVPASSLFLSVITIQELEIGVLLAERRDFTQGAILRTWLEKHPRSLAVNAKPSQP